MTDSFVGQSAGGGKRTAAAVASKRAVMNDKCRVDVIHYARWNGLNGRYRFRLSIQCSVGQLILPFPSQVEYCHLVNLICFVLDHIRYAACRR